MKLKLLWRLYKVGRTAEQYEYPMRNAELRAQLPVQLWSVVRDAALMRDVIGAALALGEAREGYDDLRVAHDALGVAVDALERVYDSEMANLGNGDEGDA